METEPDLGGKYPWPNKPNEIISAENEVNQALIDQFKVQGDVEMFSRLPDYYDSRCLDLSNEGELATVAENYAHDCANQRGKRLNAIYLTRKSLGEYPKWYLKSQRRAREMNLNKKECYDAYRIYLY